MRQKITLVKEQSMGNIVKCSCSLIHVNIKGVSLHFTGDGFLSYRKV